MQNINRVTLTGNLTRDPELRQTGGGLSVCQLRIAVNGRVKQAGEWTDKPNFFDVVCFGAQADNVSRYLAKGRPVAIDGRLDWREWEQDGNKRQAVQIIAETVQFLSDGNRESGGERSSAPAAAVSSSSGYGDEDDIPF